jgi:uncharacterized repeat protein (TIGR03803 family)
MTKGTSVWDFVQRAVRALLALVAIVTFVLMTGPLALAQTLTTLHNFCEQDNCPNNPYGSMIQATDGNLYGITISAGNTGTVFSITLSGALTTLHTFESPSLTYPSGGLIQAANGNFYGTTVYGIGDTDYGAIFELTPTGTLTTLYNFCALGTYPFCTDGFAVNSELVQVANGDIYGATERGGVNDCGTIFKITPSGTLTTLYNFLAHAGGHYPLGGLIRASNGDFYGTTELGGANKDGVVFSMTESDTVTTLNSFNGTDGEFALGLTEADNGDFYGITDLGGPDGFGTVFKMNARGNLTALYTFCSQGAYPYCTDGANPQSSLIQATDGNFYGMTVDGGANDAGVIYRITPDGAMSTIYTFCSQQPPDCTDGVHPYGALVQATNGDLYGATSQGGTGQGGTIFSLSVGLGPFVALRTTSGKVGAKVAILGTNLTGATSVAFNGTPAGFAVNSTGSAILAAVPVGATSGTVTVTMPSGVLSSDKLFTVLD